MRLNKIKVLVTLAVTMVCSYAQAQYDLTTPGGGVITYSESHADYPGTKAFDNAVTTTGRWLPKISALPDVYVAYEFAGGASHVVQAYQIWNHVTYSVDIRAPKDFNLQGSSNGVDWVELDTQTNQVSWASGEARLYMFSNTVAYSHFKLNITANNGDSLYTGFCELELFPPPEQLACDDFYVGPTGYTAATTIEHQNPYRPGFTAAWGNTTSGLYKPNNEGLVYTNGTTTLLNSGGSLQIVIPAHADRSMYRQTTGFTEDVMYISTLMSFDADGEVNDFTYLHLMDSSNPVYGVQWGLLAGDLAIRCRSEAGTNDTKYVLGTGAYVEGEVYLFVLKLEKNINDWRDRVTVYL